MASAEEPRPGGRPLRVLVALPHYLPAFRGGGPIRTVAAMVERHGDRNAFRVVTGDHDWGETEPLPVVPETWTRVGGAGVWYAREGSFRSWWRTYRQIRALRPDVLYLNGVFPWRTSVAPLALRRCGFLPGDVLLAPRGEFGAGALGLRARKKDVFLRLARTTGLFDGVVWHASTTTEATEIAAVVPGARVLVRENESSLPRTAERQGPSPSGGGRLRVAYVGRIADKKGVDVLLEALGRLDRPVALELVGPAPEAAYLARCRALADRARGVGHDVRWVGPLAPEAVRDVFRRNDVFAFPTAHENFGHTIAEALSVGCPVLLPATTPWTDTVTAGGGEILTSRRPGEWADALQRWTELSAAERADRRAHAADAYDAWQRGRPEESVFDLL